MFLALKCSLLEDCLVCSLPESVKGYSALIKTLDGNVKKVTSLTFEIRKM